MTKARSPRYPAIGLPDAIAKARQIYDGDHINKIPKEVVAKHIGFKTLHGNALAVISALLKYGLIGGSSDAMKVTDRAVAILVNEKGQPDRVKAVKEAALSPMLFVEIDSEFPNGKVSDQALRSFLLLKKKFLQSAVDGAIRAYRETMDLVTEEEHGYNSAEKIIKPSDEVEPMMQHGPGPQSNAAEALAIPQPHNQIGHPTSKPIVFDMETVSGQYEFNNAEDLDDFIQKLIKIKSLMPSKASDPKVGTGFGKNPALKQEDKGGGPDAAGAHAALRLTGARQVR